MDTFMDRLSQKMTAQEIIKANAAAEAEEMNQLKTRIKEYNDCLEQIQDASKELLAVSDQISRMLDETLNGAVIPQIQKLVEDGSAKLEAAKVDGSEVNQQINALVEEGVAKLNQAKVDAGEVDRQINSLVEEGIAKLETARVNGDEVNRQINTLVENGVAKLSEAKVDGNEVNRQIAALVKDGMAKLDHAKVDGGKINSQINSLVEESIAKIKELQQSTEALEEMKKLLTQKLDDTNESVHKECVKVYRNVQAAVMEENGKYSENITNSMKEMKGKVGIIFGLSASALGIAAVSLIIQIVSMLGIY